LLVTTSSGPHEFQHSWNLPVPALPTCGKIVITSLDAAHGRYPVSRTYWSPSVSCPYQQPWSAIWTLHIFAPSLHAFGV
jgi:hypothetical protein